MLFSITDHSTFFSSIFIIDPVSCTTSDDDENEFYDAQELSAHDGTFSLDIPANLNDINGESSSDSEELNSCETEPNSNHSTQVSFDIILLMHRSKFITYN